MNTFDLVNDGQSPMAIIIEPECLEFELAPGGQVTVHVGRGVPAFAAKFSTFNEKQSVSFWPDKGKVEVTFEGTNVMELI